MASVHSLGSPRPPSPLPPRVVQRIEERLRRHLTPAAVPRVRDAVVGGQVVHLESGQRAPIVAYKRGVLFVAGTEYVIDDE